MYTHLEIYMNGESQTGLPVDSRCVFISPFCTNLPWIILHILLRFVSSKFFIRIYKVYQQQRLYSFSAMTVDLVVYPTFPIKVNGGEYVLVLL